MQSIPTVFVELYMPILLAITCICAAFRSRKGERGTILKLKPFGDFVEYQLDVANVFVVRGILTIGCFGCLSAYLFYDYPTYFPQDYQMEVFFDERGLTQSLSVFSAKELKDLSIPNDRAKYQQLYFQQLDTEVQRVFGDPAFFNAKVGYVHSAGHAQFVAEKLVGWQNYHVVTSEGVLTHFLDSPNQAPKKFYTGFDKLPSEDDYFSLTLSDIFLQHSMTLRTQYKQYLVQNKMSEEHLFKLTLIGITKVTIFPWPHVSNTVYLGKFENIGLVPVAYAIYR